MCSFTDSQTPVNYCCTTVEGGVVNFDSIKTCKLIVQVVPALYAVKCCLLCMPIRRTKKDGLLTGVD